MAAVAVVWSPWKVRKTTDIPVSDDGSNPGNGKAKETVRNTGRTQTALLSKGGRDRMATRRLPIVRVEQVRAFTALCESGETCCRIRAGAAVRASRKVAYRVRIHVKRRGGGPHGFCVIPGNAFPFRTACSHAGNVCFHGFRDSAAGGRAVALELLESCNVI